MPTPHGNITVSWRRENGNFLLDIILPAPITAIVHLPQAREHRLNGRSLDASTCPPASLREQILLEVGAGTHHFEAMDLLSINTILSAPDKK